MRLSRERSSVVLAGAWNQAIFTPEWTAKSLFGGKPAAPVVGMLATGGLAAQYSADGVELQVLPGRLELRSTSLPIDHARLERLAADCLGQLPETPVQAYGINGGFDFAAPPEAFAQLLSFSDEAALAPFGKVEKRLLVRELVRTDSSLSINVAQAKGRFQVDLNVHRPVNADARRAKELLPEGSVKAAFDEFLRVLHDVYKLELEE